MKKDYKYSLNVKIVITCLQKETHLTLNNGKDRTEFIPTKFTSKSQTL